MTSTLQSLWEDLQKQAILRADSSVLEGRSLKNSEFMKQMSFADTFIASAEFQRGVVLGDLQLDWMYSWLQRQNRFFELRPKMLPIGDDGCGNFIYIYDISNPNSQVLYLGHDPAVLMVIADSFEVFLQQIMDIVKDNPNEEEPFAEFMQKHDLFEASMKIWKGKTYNGNNNDLGFSFQEVSDDKVHANFAKAKAGSGISLAFFGKYTEIDNANLKEVVSFKKMELDGVEKLKRKDRLGWIYLAILLPLSYALLGLLHLVPLQRVVIIFCVLLLSPWVFDFVRFIRKSGPRL